MGKTSGYIIPTIFSCSDDSLIINDPKGELYDITSEYRSRLGGVFKIEWGNSCDIFFNPYDLDNLPINSAERGDYVDIITNILIKNNNEKDPFWNISARKFMQGISLYLIYKEEMNNKSTSLPDIISFISRLSLSDDENTNINPINANLENIIQEVQNFNINLNMKNRIINNLADIKSTPENTRGGILASLSSALSIFNNENVIKITSKNNIDITKLNKSITTTYLIVPALDQELYGVLSAIFLEIATRQFTKNKSDIKVRFVLDEFAFIPPTNTLINAPAISRGYNLSYIYCCQDLQQIEKNYGKQGLENIITNTAYKVILNQNNDITANRFSNMLGKYLKKEKQNNNHVIKKEVEFLKTTDLMNLPKNTSILLVQNNFKRLHFYKNSILFQLYVTIVYNF